MEEIELDENDEITPYPTSNQMNRTGKTEETLIQNEGAEDDYFLTNSQNIRLNEEKVKDIVNSKSAEETPEGNQEMEIIEEIPKETEKKYPKINMNHTMNKISHKKSNFKRKLISEEKNEKNNNDENTDELFKKAIENTSRIYPPIEHDNDLSVKVTEILYDKYVGKNVHKSKHLDIYSKFKDESIKQEREWTRTKDDAKRISNMIERQEKYEELKHDKKIGRQREQKKKIKKICVFIPNGKNNKTIQENIRTHSQFYSDQKKFVAKKEEYINKLAQNRIQTEENNKKTITVSKKSEIIANIKNPNETLEQFCKRLAEEKLKTPKETLAQKQKAEIKKMAKKNLSKESKKAEKPQQTITPSKKRRKNKKKKKSHNKPKDTKKKSMFMGLNGVWKCKECRKDAVIDTRRRNKIRLVEYKGGKCEICGYNKCIDALEFHHLNPEEKDFGLSCGDTRSLERLKVEADKCIMVCANCHREIHAKEREEKQRKKEEIEEEKCEEEDCSNDLF